MSDGGIQNVGARLVLENAAAFQAQLKESTDALQTFNDEQQRAADMAKESSDAIIDASEAQADAVKESATVSSDAVGAQAAATVEARDVIVGANADIVASLAATRAKVVAASTASTTAAAALVAGSTKVLKWGSIIAAVVGYEGVKKFSAYNQQVTQLGVNAGISAKQLPALAAGFMKVSDATGMSATNVAMMAYYLASANPKIKTTTTSLLAMTNQAASLSVLAGNSSNPTAISRMYGAIVSNAIPLTAGGKALGYSTASGTALNMWANAVTGHGDMTVGGLVGALGTGILPVSQTYGIPLNAMGAALDVLSPAMNPSAAATRLKTAIGMLGSPSSKAAEGAELFGGNVTTMASILRSTGPKGGLGGLLGYLSTLTKGRVTGSTFASAFYGGGLGSITGGTKGVGTGAGEYLRVLGFTPAQAAVMEGPGGISAFGKMSSAQLAKVGFGKGTTGANDVLAVQSSLIGGMFGGGHTGAAIMQLVNERGVYGTKLAQVAGAQNPATYNKALNLAFSEPAVAMAKFGAALTNLTIQIGQDLMPAVQKVVNGLLDVGSWFSKNKTALYALLGGAGAIYAGAAVVKTVSVVAKVVGGVKTVFGAITGLTGTTGLTGVLGLNTAAVNANTLALGGKLPSTVPGVVPGAVPGVVRAVGKTALGALALYGYNAFAEPYLKKHLTSQEDRTANDVAHGVIIGGTIASIVPGVGTLLGGGVGGAIGLLGSYTSRQTSANPVTLMALRQQATTARTQAQNAQLTLSAYRRHHGAGAYSTHLAQVASSASLQERNAQGTLVAYQHQFLSPAARVAGAMGVKTSTAAEFIGSVTRASHMKTASGQDRASFNAAAVLVAAGVQQKDAADHMHMSAAQITAAAKQEASTLEKLVTSANDQTTAATAQQSSSNNLNVATKALANAALDIAGMASNARTALLPSSIHNANNSGLKNAIARK